MIELPIALELLGLAILVYGVLQLFGIDPLYLFKLAVSRRARACRTRVYGELQELVPQRVRVLT